MVPTLFHIQLYSTHPRKSLDAPRNHSANAPTVFALKSRGAPVYRKNRLYIRTRVNHEQENNQFVDFGKLRTGNYNFFGEPSHIAVSEWGGSIVFSGRADSYSTSKSLSQPIAITVTVWIAIAESNDVADAGANRYSGAFAVSEALATGPTLGGRFADDFFGVLVVTKSGEPRMS